MILSRSLWDSWAKSLSGTSVLVTENRLHSTFKTLPEFQEMGSNLANWEGRDAETELRQEQKQQCSLGEVLWFPGKAQDNSFELSCLTRWEKLTPQRA